MYRILDGRVGLHRSHPTKGQDYIPEVFSCGKVLGAETYLGYENFATATALERTTLVAVETDRIAHPDKNELLLMSLAMPAKP
jgi:hypothetical protein